MIGIYAIRNKINGKVYIGQSRNIQKRFKQHLDALERGRHHSKKLQKDFDELGPDKFALEFLELCSSEHLDQKETEWIMKFDSIKNGYNVQDPQTRRPWSFFKREKRPGITIRSELSRIFRELLISLVEDIDKWTKGNKNYIKLLIQGMSVSFLFVLIIFLGYLTYNFLGDFAFILYIVFFIVTALAIGIISEHKQFNKR